MESQYSLLGGDDEQFTAMACLLAGRHLLNVLRSIGVQPDEIRTQAEALRQVWPAEWAYDAWCAWHACRIALRHLGIPDDEIAVDNRAQWRTAAKYVAGPVLKPEEQEEAWAELRDSIETPIVREGPDRAARILIADDDANIRKMCAVNLELEGFAHTEVGDGEEALRVIRRDRPDLVVLDVGMPVKSGWDVLREIRSDAELRATKVVMLTELMEEDDVRQAQQLGADAYVTKPFEPLELLARIGSALRKRGG
jgi:CheY-like chemotaxis protein